MSMLLDKQTLGFQMKIQSVSCVCHSVGTHAAPAEFQSVVLHQQQQQQQ